MEFVDLVSNDVAFQQALASSLDDTIWGLLDVADLLDTDRSDLAININSPGEILMSAMRMAPLIGLALFPLAASGVSYSDAIDAQVHMSTLGDSVDDCTAQVQESVRHVVQAMGAEKWLHACRLAQSATSTAAMTTDSSLE